MARIRSIHPGQWTDGDFVECSPLARLLCIALRNIADDRGIFRWKPKSIKMQCVPSDNCDIDALLGELLDNDQLECYEHEGKTYGIITDFSQWQRPKKPNAIYPCPEPVRKTHKLSQAECDTDFAPVTEKTDDKRDDFPTSSPPVPNQSPTSTEKPIQREEVRCRRKEGGGKTQTTINHKNSNSGEKSFLIEDFLSDRGEIELTRIAPGWDRGKLKREFNQLVRGGTFTAPDRPEGAFLAWVEKARTHSKPPP